MRMNVTPGPTNVTPGPTNVTPGPIPVDIVIALASDVSSASRSRSREALSTEVRPSG
jgi:hypothetical protein